MSEPQNRRPPFFRQHPSTVRTDAAQNQKVKILLVDDRPENLIALEAVLSTLDEELVLAPSGAEALRYLLDEDFAAVLLDVRMPEMDGFETALSIRSRPRCRHIPILFLSKYNSDAQLIRGYDLGAVDFLSMPIVPQVLRSKVSVFVELHRKAALLREQAAVLQRAEQKFRSLLEAAPDAMIVSRESGEIVLANWRATAIFGYAQEEMVASPIQRLVPDWSYQIPLAPEETFRLTGRSGAEREYKAIRQDGSRFLAELTTSLLQTEEGVLITTALRDITDRKRTEQQIRELSTYKELARALDLTHMIVRDIGGKIRVWTQGAEQFYGWTAAEALGTVSWELLHTEFPEPLQEVQERLRRGDQWQGELRRRTKDGGEIFVASHWVAHYNDTGELLISEVSNDITERKVVELALRESEERFRKVFEENPVGKVFVQPETGRYLQVNPTFARMLGYQPEEFAHLTTADVTHPDDRELGREGAQQVFRGEIPGVHFEKRYVTKSGAVMWASVHEVPVRDVQGHTLYNMAIVEDITPRKQAEQALRRLNEELSEFAHIAAHDLQTPLRNMKQFAQLLASRYQGQLDETADRFLDYLISGAEQMQELIHALLAYARQGGQSTTREAVQVPAVLDTVLANLKSEIEQTGATVVYQALPAVQGDFVQLTQLFQNLVENALKYRGEKPPRITIAAERQPRKWLFAVQDNGVGIPGDQRERIFTPLKRLHGPEIRGTGIGLAICKKIVEGSGGRIWVESEVGRGSTFYFTLPAKE
jgi:PAS domain S-box-containing protein